MNQRYWLLLLPFLLMAPPIVPAAQAAGPVESMEGELRVYVEDRPAEKQAFYHYQLIRGTETLTVVPPHGRLSARARSGLRVRVHGHRTGNSVTLDTSDLEAIQTLDSSGSLLSSAGSTSAQQISGQQTISGVRTVAVLFVNFQNDTRTPFTPSVDGPRVVYGASGLDNVFYQQQSYGLMSLTGQAYGWYTLPMNATCNPGNYGTIQNLANQAAAADGFHELNFDHVMYVFPTESDCTGIAGEGEIGGMPGHMWFNGYFDQRTTVHELGHNLGLYHAHGLSCGSAPYVPGRSGCTTDEYGDPYDAMGMSLGYGYHFDAPHKEFLGWITVPARTATGVYAINPMETAASAVKGVQVTAAAHGTDTYYLEYQSNINKSDYITGPLFHVAFGGETWLLDMKPGTSASWDDSALALSKTFTDPNAGISFVTQSIDASAIQVGMTFPTVSATPSMALTKSCDKTIVKSGDVLTYTIAFQNNGDGSANNFVLTDIVPPGTTPVPNSISNGGTLAGGTIQWPAATVLPASGGTVHFQVTVN